MSTNSVKALNSIAFSHLTRFETRKVIFNAKDALSSNIEEGLRSAVRFELLWLENKRNYYESLAREDATRIKMLQDRVSASTA